MCNSSNRQCQSDGALMDRILDMQKLFCFAAFIFLLVAPVVLTAQKAVPELWGLHVHDEAGVLSQRTVDELENRLKVYEDSTSNQIAVLVIQNLDGEILEQYSIRVVEKWKLGQKEKDNGVLLLISVDDHKMRIEAGQGVEGVLTDAISNRIIRNEMAPHFRKNDYDGGVVAGINGIIAAIGGEYSAEESDSGELGWKERLLLGAFIFGILGVFTCVGLFVPGCAGWFLYAFLIPFYAAFPAVVFGPTGGLTMLGVYVIGFPVLKMVLARTPWGKRMATKVGSSNSRGKGWSSGSGWLTGSSGGGWSSSSGGGGFSGGGGSFGGGGSSGSW